MFNKTLAEEMINKYETLEEAFAMYKTQKEYYKQFAPIYYKKLCKIFNGSELVTSQCIISERMILQALNISQHELYYVLLYWFENKITSKSNGYIII